MAYAVYYKRENERAWARAGELVTATKGKLKGTLIHRDFRFDKEIDARLKAAEYTEKGYRIIVKTVK